MDERVRDGRPRRARWELKMVWGFLRDMGILVLTGGGVAFGLSKFLRGVMAPEDLARLAYVGDTTMLVGACLTVAAMAIGYLVSGGSPL